MAVSPQLGIKPIVNPEYLAVLDLLLEEMLSGVIPWQKPWFIRAPRNILTGKAYTGVNVFNLNLIAKKWGYASNYWGTKKQIEKLGGKISRDQIDHPHAVFLYKWNQTKKIDKYGKEKQLWGLMMRVYRVYNYEQTSKLAVPRDTDNYNLFGFEQIADDVYRNYKGAPPVLFNPDRAAYYPYKDIIEMPEMRQFVSSEEYYCTLFHEMIHSTGHPKRLKRSGFLNSVKNYKESYAWEELVAEIGAAFLADSCGFFGETRKNSAAYLNSWIAYFEEDTTAMLRAAAAAQRAGNFIRGIVDVEETNDPMQLELKFDDTAWEKLDDIRWD